MHFTNAFVFSVFFSVFISVFFSVCSVFFSVCCFEDQNIIQLKKQLKRLQGKLGLTNHNNKGGVNLPAVAYSGDSNERLREVESTVTVLMEENKKLKQEKAFLSRTRDKERLRAEKALIKQQVRVSLVSCIVVVGIVVCLK